MIVAAIVVGVPLLIVAVVGVQTWRPLEKASDTLVELERSLGAEADYVPAPTGAIAPERIAVFLDLFKPY